MARSLRLAGRRSTRRSTRRERRTRFASIAAVAAVLLVLTVVFQTQGSTSPIWRLLWAMASITITVSLLTMLIAEVVRQLRTERLLTRADAALQPVSRLVGDEDENRSFGVLLEDLVSSVAGAVDAAWVELRLDDGSEHGIRVTRGARPAEEVPRPNHARRSAWLANDLVYEQRRIGSLELASTGRSFGGNDRLLLPLLAERVATQIERARMADTERRSRREAEQARGQVNVLARASVPLAPALDNPEEAIAEIGNIVVPEFADLFAVDLVREGGQLERIVELHRDPAVGRRLAERSAEFPNWPDTLRRVMDRGTSELAFTDESHNIIPKSDDHGVLLQAIGMQSWVVAPISVRGLALGTMTLATEVGRRGYRPSDQVTIDDLVARSSIAFERGLLYEEARQATRDASGRADELARLVEATIAFTRTLEPSALLDALVEQASYVVDAPHAHAQLVGDIDGQAQHGPVPSDPVDLTVSLVDHLGQAMGQLTVQRPSDTPFTTNDEAVIAMLAGLASVASRNAGLYQDVRNREQRLQALIEASPLAILELDAAGAVQVANPAAQTLFPVTEPGATSLAQPPVELVDRLADLTARAVRGERGEAELTTTDGMGERRELMVSTAPVSEGDGSVHVLAVISDMTGRKRLEEQLATAQRFEAIATLAGGVAHDFNNLLTVILGYSEILLHSLAEAPALREQVEAIQEAGNHAAVITNQLLTLSRHQVLQPETIDAGERCAALIPMLRRLAGDGVTVDEVRQAGSHFIKVDPGQLEQVLFNLVFNGRDAMPQGGRLEIEVGNRVAADGAKMVLVRVTDDGEGMDAETLARCQEPFFTTKGRSRGIGLGLATVASILERSGGTLEIESTPGLGTSFTVVFPLADEAGPAPVPAIDRAPAQVLLVDDDDQVRRFAARALTDGGYCVTGVSDGESAIRLIDGDGEFDLIVTDFTLPGISGFEVLRVVRDRRPHMARLLITGFADGDHVDIDAGDTTLVPKPFTSDDLVRAAGSALRTAR